VSDARLVVAAFGSGMFVVGAGDDADVKCVDDSPCELALRPIAGPDPDLDVFVGGEPELGVEKSLGYVNPLFGGSCSLLPLRLRPGLVFRLRPGLVFRLRLRLQLQLVVSIPGEAAP
jgi:hypothetical protein